MNRLSIVLIATLSFFVTNVSSQCSDINACNFGTELLEECIYPGNPCDDGNPQTNGETYNEVCNCLVEGEMLIGCTEADACNYSTVAQFDDGTCVFPGSSCDDGIDSTSDDFINEECECSGNYQATFILYDTGGDGWSGTEITLENTSNGEIYDGISLEQGLEDQFNLALTPGCYQVTTSEDLNGNEVSFSIGVETQDGIEDVFGTSNDFQTFSVGGVSGCTDPFALNYNEDATCESGDCFFCVEDGDCDYSELEGMSGGPCNTMDIVGPGHYVVRGTSYSGYLGVGASVRIFLSQPPIGYDILIRDGGSPMTTSYGGVTKQSGGNGHNNCVYVDLINCKLIYYVWQKNKMTISMNDSEGNAWEGVSYEVKDENYNELFSGSLNSSVIGDGTFFGADEFDLEDGCYFLSFQSEFGEFPSETTYRIDNIDQGFVCGALTDEVIPFSLNSNICEMGCTDSTAYNFDQNANVPCLGDNSCCKYTAINTVCSEAEELTSGELVQWSTEETGLNQEPMDESVALWYSYQPSCLELVSIAGISSNGFEFCLYEECSSDTNLIPIYCSADNLDNQNQGGFRLEADRTYYLKIMTNYDLSTTGAGQLKLESLGCLGCTQEGAFNYDEYATLDNGSCLLGGFCVGDLNGDLGVTSADLTILLSSFGQDCSE